MGRPKITNLLMWVGATHYPTVTSFTREAARLGVSKRVPQVPVGVKLGRSLLFLAHDEAVRVTCRKCAGRGVVKGKLNIKMVKKVGRSWEPVLKPSKKGAVEVRNRVAMAKDFREVRDTLSRSSNRKRKWIVVPGQKMCGGCKGRGERPNGRIFGFCVVERLELVFDGAPAANEYMERREALRLRDRVGLTYVPGIEKEPKRGCGYRCMGGYYLAAGGEEASQEAQLLANGLGVSFRSCGPLVVFPAPVACREDRFRAMKVVDKHLILKAAIKAAKTQERVFRKRKRKAKKRAK